MRQTMTGATSINTTPATRGVGQTKSPCLALAAVILVSGAIVALPVFLIMPFKPQTKTALALSYSLKQWSPTLTIVLLACALLIVAYLWPRVRSWQKSTLVVAVLLTLPPAWFARQNYFEWMFNPLSESHYASIGDAGDAGIGGEDMVLAVKINNEAVAYPVRIMAYHHLVQDTVGGTPICATY